MLQDSTSQVLYMGLNKWTMIEQRCCRSDPLGTRGTATGQGWSRCQADMPKMWDWLPWSHSGSSTQHYTAQHTKMNWSQSCCRSVTRRTPCKPPDWWCPSRSQGDIESGRMRQLSDRSCLLCSWCTLR
jgi:hypothetical protein